MGAAAEGGLRQALRFDSAQELETSCFVVHGHLNLGFGETSFANLDFRIFYHSSLEILSGSVKSDGEGR